jgi:hypothetical protein
MNPVVYLPSQQPCECVRCTMRALMLQAELRDPRYGIFAKAAS